MYKDKLTNENGAYAQAEREHQAERMRLKQQKREISGMLEDLAALSLAEGKGAESVSEGGEGNKRVAVSFTLENGAQVSYHVNYGGGESGAIITYPAEQEGESPMRQFMHESSDRNVSVMESGDDLDPSKISALHELLAGSRDKAEDRVKSAAKQPKTDDKPLFGPHAAAQPMDSNPDRPRRQIIIN